MSKLAIFDLDGTLCDTLVDIYSALSDVFKDNSMNPPSLEEAQTLMGDGLKAFLNKASMLHGNFNCPANIVEQFIDRYSQNCTNKTIMYEGIPELLCRLKSDNVQLAVVSNKSELLVKKILEYFNLIGEFIMIVGGDTFPEKKPSPLPILNTLQSTGFARENAIIMGDSINDVSSGCAAGILTCYCSYGYGVLSDINPDFTVSNPAEIYNIIKRMK